MAADLSSAAVSENPSASSSVSPEYLSASSILVFHPGSRFLRFGRASDPLPMEMFHCLARRRKRGAEGTTAAHREPVLLSRAKLADFRSVEECRAQVEQSLQTSIQSSGAKRFSVPVRHVLESNAKVRAEKLGEIAQEWFNPTSEEVVVGEDVLRLSPAADFNVHFPFRRGDINLHPGIGGSQTSILVDLETIWSHAIEHHLMIPLSELGKFRAVLVIPALYKRSLIKHYLSILLLNLGFGGAFVIQDHVAATFGAGLGYACVVDIGDQKTSISCVEDGISHPETRIHLDYGGADIAQVFYYLLRKAGFPYKQCQPDANSVDAQILQRLKEENCHLDLDRCGMTQKRFAVKFPGREPVRYSIYFGDETFLAPSALFHTDLLELTSGRKSVRRMGKDPGDPEDPHDHIYLGETSRKYTKAGAAGEAGEPSDCQAMDDDLEIVADVIEGGSLSAGSAHGGLSDQAGLLSLDQAILKSIEACPNEDLKRKMYSCILLVGGGGKFGGIEKYLLGKLALQVPFQYRTDPMEITMDAKDLSSSTTTWKGAAVLACLETAQELWIGPREWRRHGQKLLREKAPFPWA